MGTLSQLCGVDLRLLTGLHFRTNEVLLASKRGQGPHGSISSKFGHQMAPLALVTLVSLTQWRTFDPNIGPQVYLGPIKSRDNIQSKSLSGFISKIYLNTLNIHTVFFLLVAVDALMLLMHC